MSRHPCSRTVQCATSLLTSCTAYPPLCVHIPLTSTYKTTSSPSDLPSSFHLYPEQKNAERTYNNQPVEQDHTKLKSQNLNSQTFGTKMSDNNNSSAQQPKQAGGFFGGLSNAAGGLASGVGGVASGTVNTVGGVVGNVGRGVGKTLSDASSGLENTAKGAGGAIGDTTGAKKQPETK
ncbi:hypothetical protein E4T47_08987 [Aureobasidium subglaciale]|nr:hypothetical protein E4T43_02303 [Aureobasidium subglaciale]KAI5263612.1 hypothetical protein E4T47_08987 [Aureobasidium subglaciale]